MDITNFPKAGDDKAVTLRNSEVARFDLGYAESLREKYPDIWNKGGNIKGNAQFAILSRIVKHGGAPKTRAEDKAVRLREAWAARHFKDHRLPGVVAQIKWLVVGEQGEGAMKKVIEEQKAKNDGRAATTGAGGVGETRDLAQRPERRAGDEGESPLYLQQAHVRAVRRESRPTAKSPDREVVVVEFVASTETRDSHDSIIRSNWDLTRYNKNAVLLWMHGRMNDLPALGNVENLMKVGSTKHEGNAVFDDTTEFDRAVAAKYEKGVLKGFSIGFYPRDIHFERVDGEDVLILDDIEILEISCVNVPSNPEALAKSEREALVQIENTATTNWERAIARMSASPQAYRALHERAVVALEKVRAAVPFASYAIKEGSWDASAAEKRIKTWATKDGEVDFAKYAKAFTWVDPEKKDTEGGYKLPHHDVDGEKLVTVKAGVIAAGNAIQGSRGGVKIPDADMDAVKSHLARHYKELGLTPPWERAANHGDRQMSLKTLTIEERDIAHRADKKGVQCEATCPNCSEKMLVKMDHVPVPSEKFAEYEALSARAAKFDADMKAADAAKAEIATQRDAALARTAELEKHLSDTRAAIVQTRVDAAEEALKVRSGKKLFPTELAFEIDLARTYLSDLTPSDKPEHKGRSLGEIKWAGRLALLDARADLNIVTPPATTGANAEKPRETDKDVQGAADGASETRVSMQASADVSSLLAKNAKG